MKVFISHKQEDGPTATSILNTLVTRGAEAYLDLLDGQLALKGEALTNHVKGRLNECTDLLVVMSEQTKGSWWVPFEIGMAAQKDFPIVNYLTAGVQLPDYLEYWPRLRNSTDLATYVETKRSVMKRADSRKRSGESVSMASETAQFYSELRTALRS